MPVSSSFGFSEAALPDALFPLLNNVCSLTLLFWPEIFFFFLVFIFCSVLHIKLEDLFLVEHLKTENT